MKPEACDGRAAQLARSADVHRVIISVGATLSRAVAAAERQPVRRRNPVTFHVRIYCLDSCETGSCDHEPSHPFTLVDAFATIRLANDRGGEIVAGYQNHDIQWEVLDSRGRVVC